MENLVILENSANFDPRDIDEIQLSIGWTEQKYVDAAPLWSHYDIFRNCDYFATAKIGEKTVGVLEAFADRDNFATSYLSIIMVHKDYQKKGVGRALMNAPAIVLADEPTGNLDSKNSQEIVELLKLSNKKYQQTMIIITHDESIALQADRIISIEDGKITRDERIREV